MERQENRAENGQNWGDLLEIQVLASRARGRRFKSCTAHHPQNPQICPQNPQVSLLGNQEVTSGGLVGRVSGQEIEQVVGQVNGQGKKQGKGQDKGQIVGQAWGQLVAGFLFSKQISGATENTLQWFKYILMVYQTFHQTRIHPPHPLTEAAPLVCRNILLGFWRGKES